MTIRKVMLVDDDDDIREIGTMALSEVGQWQVVEAASGSEALTACERETPDVVLLDVMMPEMDGPTTFHSLRKLKSGKEVPIIFMTAKVQKHEVEGYLKLGAQGVIRKPFDPLTLPDEVRQIVGQGSNT